MFLVPLLLLAAADLSFTVEVAAGKVDRHNDPVRVPLTLPAGKTFTALASLEGKELPVALATPQLGSTGKENAEAWMILPKLEAGKTATVKLTLREGKPQGPLNWKKEAERATLLNDSTPVLQYEHPVLDESKREATFKVYHHAYSPEGVLLTKGVGGEFTHHRGLFYGFMKVSYDKTTVDIWHCRKQTHQAHKAFLDESAPNAVVGRHRVQIDWNGDGNKTFAVEERELAAFPLPGGTLIQFTSKLTPVVDEIKLDGDPQHAGFHFRASNEVAGKDARKTTVFIRPDGVGKPGTETNWPGNKNHVNLPWLAMQFGIGKDRYTAAYLDLPTNPKEARFSERTYGRFGSYFVTTVTKDKPLLVRYRVWLQKGTMTPEAIEALSKAFVEPAAVTVK
jgi:hypothetical protein